MKRWIAAFVALWVAFTGWAQSTIRVDVHNIVELSERFNIVFMLRVSTLRPISNGVPAMISPSSGVLRRALPRAYPS